jgi:hypothetical protein
VFDISIGNAVDYSLTNYNNRLTYRTPGSSLKSSNINYTASGARYETASSTTGVRTYSGIPTLNGVTDASNASGSTGANGIDITKVASYISTYLYSRWGAGGGRGSAINTENGRNGGLGGGGGGHRRSSGYTSGSIGVYMRTPDDRLPSISGNNDNVYYSPVGTSTGSGAGGFNYDTYTNTIKRRGASGIVVLAIQNISMALLRDGGSDISLFSVRGITTIPTGIVPVFNTSVRGETYFSFSYTGFVENENLFRKDISGYTIISMYSVSGYPLSGTIRLANTYENSELLMVGAGAGRNRTIGEWAYTGAAGGEVRAGVGTISQSTYIINIAGQSPINTSGDATVFIGGNYNLTSSGGIGAVDSAQVAKTAGKVFGLSSNNAIFTPTTINGADVSYTIPIISNNISLTGVSGDAYFWGGAGANMNSGKDGGRGGGGGYSLSFIGNTYTNQGQNFRGVDIINADNRQTKINGVNGTGGGSGNTNIDNINGTGGSGIVVLAIKTGAGIGSTI